MNYSLYSMLLVAYLLGSLSFAIIVSKFMKMDDPRNYGSNNAGATNVMRSGNKKAAAFTLLGDLLKGLIVVLVARFLMRGIDGGDAIVGICGVLAVIGHIFPIFFKFKGGKGVATAIGVLLGFSPILALLVVVSWFVVFKFTRVSSLSAILATFLSPLYAYVLFQNTSYFGATLMIAVIVIFKHQSNIVRLIKGEEASFKRKEKTEHAKSNSNSDEV
ncbi:MAG TPA: glycerol-3-phosphate 1-O-acyltransferase PlsY [Burkholderiales bacterium]|nr:glycerol-3-phosphate 1-O-acyltransferase PlsY [Burkholderiales bacterium]